MGPMLPHRRKCHEISYVLSSYILHNDMYIIKQMQGYFISFECRVLIVTKINKTA